jgi:hypothetical protein
MKTEWQFIFETKDFIFEKSLTFKGNISNSEKNTNIEYNGQIVPDKNKFVPTAMQTGKLYITLPLRLNEAKQFAYYLVSNISQKITFEFGEFKIHGGMIACKNIPETQEEEIEVGDTPYNVEAIFEKAIDPNIFKTSAFEKISSLPLDIDLVAQHNSATKASNPIDKFMGYFKILESQFPPISKKQYLRESFTGNKILYDIFVNTFELKNDEDPFQKFDEFISSIVRTRHRCSHLKKYSNFGYLPEDPKIKTEVGPLLQPLEILTHESIKYFAKTV